MRNLRRGTCPTVRNTGVLAGLIVCLAAGSGPVVAARDESLTVFLNLPIANGFSDATHALVETKGLVRNQLSAATDLRMVEGPEDADVVLTVIGRGRGHAELTAALHNISDSIVAPSVPITNTERYIEILLTTGSCRNSALTVGDHAPDSCYRRIFVGVGIGEVGERRSAKKPQLNSWEACAEAVVRDLRAWLTENAKRLRIFRTSAPPR